MVVLVDCAACRHGDHDGHVAVVQAVGEGAFGGARCICKGDCAQRAAPRLRAEQERLRELYENVVDNRARFGWTINHLLECEEAWRCAEEQNARLRAALEDLAGDYGCTLLTPAAPSLPPPGCRPCRERDPDDPETWCYACVASHALAL